MGKKLFIGNLTFSTTDQTLQDAFSKCGTVESAQIIMDRESGRSKGFGFVEMSTELEAEAAINQYNGADFNGRAMIVNEAKPMENRERRGNSRPGGFSNNRGGYSGGAQRRH